MRCGGMGGIDEQAVALVPSYYFNLPFLDIYYRPVRTAHAPSSRQFDIDQCTRTGGHWRTPSSRAIFGAFWCPDGEPDPFLTSVLSNPKNSLRGRQVVTRFTNHDMHPSTTQPADVLAKVGAVVASRGHVRAVVRVSVRPVGRVAHRYLSVKVRRFVRRNCTATAGQQYNLIHERKAF